MASKASHPGADAPTHLPAESKTNDNPGAPNNAINKVYKQSKSGVDPARNAARPPNQALPIRETSQSDKKVPKTTGHKRTNSDDSMLVSPSDREDNPSRERVPHPDPRRLREETDDMAGIGSVFQGKTPQREN